MVAIAFTVAFEGVEARLVEVQASVSAGMPSFGIVGLPDKAVSEARDRVRAAFNALSIAMPSRRVTVNLSPADLPKEGSHFDLPIALAVLAALDIVPPDELAGVVSLGELALDGRLVAVAAYDFTVMAGSMGMTGEMKVARLRDLALGKRIPMVWLLDSAGERFRVQFRTKQERSVMPVRTR